MASIILALSNCSLCLYDVATAIESKSSNNLPTRTVLALSRYFRRTGYEESLKWVFYSKANHMKSVSHMARNPFLNGILATTFESAGVIFSIPEISSLA